jgi:hypothetical protein
MEKCNSPKQGRNKKKIERGIGLLLFFFSLAMGFS